MTLVHASGAARSASAQSVVAPRPNVIVVMTDDQTLAQLKPRFMPKTMALLKDDGGTEFSHSYVSSPLCCPSRAGFLTGQYPHNDGVFDNEPGYPALRDKDETLFTWLRDAGYRTAHLGRFLLNYDLFSMRPPDDYSEPFAAPPPPPGVDEWFGFAQGQTLYFNAPFSDDGVPVRLGTKRSGYTTRVLNERARQFVRASAPSEQPFFLWLAHLAPHTTNFQPRGSCGSGAALNEPGTYAAYRNEELPEPPSFGEKANGDKPTWVQTRPPLRKRQVIALRKAWRCALASLTSVDRGVANLVRELRAQGELESTAIFFTSDNGYLYGEHRVVLEKIYPYEESWRVPLLARVPSAYLGGAEPPAVVGENVSNIDLTATILDLADASPCTASGECRTIDGRSILPLLGAPGLLWPADRAVLAQIGNRACGIIPAEGSGLKNHYDAIRTQRYKYAEINRVNPDTGECNRAEFELYDLEADPYELKNTAVNPALRAPSPIQAALAARLDALTRCSGVAERDPPAEPDEVGPRPPCE